MSESDVSESTIEPFLLSNVLDSLDRGAKEAIETKDYLTYSTLLDIYLGDTSKYTIPEREELLAHLLTILKEHKELTYEIGWDLPSLLISYVRSDFIFNGPIRDAPCVYKILKCFEVLAHEGNPKELFLKSCEILTSLKVEEDNEFEEDEDATEVEQPSESGQVPQKIVESTKGESSTKEEAEKADTESTLSDDNEPLTQEEINAKFFNIELYCVFELIDSCLKRIKTLYPSRFLSMTITSFFNSVHTNRDTCELEFITKRAVSFVKNYASPGLPDDHGLSDEELATIKDDEDYLQRKLLTGFISHVYHITISKYLTGYTHEYLKYLVGPDVQMRPGVVGSIGTPTHLDMAVCERMVGLAESLDIPMADHFKKFVTESHALFHSFNYEKDDDDLSGEIFEKAVIDYQQTLGGSIVDSDGKTINDSPQGLLLFYTHSVVSKKDFEVAVTFNDALVLTLRLIIPAMVDERFSSRAIKDLCLYWMWHAIHVSEAEGKNLELEVASVPKVLLAIYCHLLLFICQDKYLRYVGLTTLTKVLTFIPEDITYGFFKDSLHSVPFESSKALLVGVLKELLMKDKIKDVNALEESLAKVSIDNSTTSAPTLPVRSTVANTKFLTLNQVRFEDLLELIVKSNNETFIQVEGTPVIDPTKLATLSAYMNLIVVIKTFPIVVKNREALDKTLAKVKTNIKTIEEKHKSDSERSLEYNAAGMLQITLDRIGS